MLVGTAAAVRTSHGLTLMQLAVEPPQVQVGEEYAIIPVAHIAQVSPRRQPLRCLSHLPHLPPEISP